MRLIDADALIDELGISDEDIIFEGMLVDAPTIDAVPVVRCKDCEYYHQSFCEIWSKYGTIQTREQGFCYMAERRDDE